MLKVSSLLVVLTLGLAGEVHAANKQADFGLFTLPAAKVYNDSKFICPTDLEMMPTDSDMPSIWLDGSNWTVIDPSKLAAYNAARKPFDNARYRVNKLVEQYFTGFGYSGGSAAAPKPGDSKIGACLYEILGRWADKNALLGKMSNQATDYSEFTIPSAAIGLLTAKTSLAPIDPARVRFIEDWMRRVSDIPINRFSYSVALGKANNHYYWAGYSAIIVGMATSDAARFDYGRTAIHKGLADIGPGGFLPLELARGAYALQYHSVALQPLSMGALLLKNLGETFTPKEIGNLSNLSGIVIEGAYDPARFVALAKQFSGLKLSPQPQDRPLSEFLSPMEPLSRLYPTNLRMKQIKATYAPLASANLGPSLDILLGLTAPISIDKKVPLVRNF